jgi:hypothetical protein
VALLVGSYLAIAAIALWYRWGVLATFLVAPLAMGLVRSFRAGKMKDLVEETAKFHLPFGVLLVLGVLYTKTGLLELLQVL